MSGEVWTFAEVEEGCISEASREAMAEGKKLAARLGMVLCSVLLGSGVARLVEQLASFGAQRVYVADSPLLQSYAPNPYVSMIAGAVDRYRPEAILLGNALVGRDLAASLAGRLRVGLAPDSTFINVGSSGEIQVIRPVLAGKAAATIGFSADRPWLVTLRTGVISVSSPVPGQTAEVVDLELPPAGVEPGTRSLGIVKGDVSQIDLTEADVVVAGGRGVGGAENFKLIEQLASVLGGKVAGSRYGVDAGWIPRNLQVGQSGKTVTPKLYIACGISGAVHHVTGMRDSKTIIALNKDRTFKVADLGIVGDLLEIVPAMIEQLRKSRPDVASA